MHAVVSQSAFLSRLLDRRPRGVPAERLVRLLALEARPRSILVIGDDRAHTAVEQAFPLARVDRVAGVAPGSPLHTEPSGQHDAILCVQGLTHGFKSDQDLARQLVAHLPEGGHLAILELTGVPEIQAVLGGAPLVESLSDVLVPLHLSKESVSMGVWRHMLFVGRKGRVIR